MGAAAGEDEQVGVVRAGVGVGEGGEVLVLGVSQGGGGGEEERDPAEGGHGGDGAQEEQAAGEEEAGLGVGVGEVGGGHEGAW